MQKVHFRLTFVAHKCFSLSSLLIKKPLNVKGILINAASLFENAFLILVKSPQNMYPLPPPPTPSSFRSPPKTHYEDAQA